MVNVVKIQDNLNGLVGFRQPFNPTFAILDTANTTSRSGLFVNDNEFVNVEILKDSQDYEGISNTDFNTYLQNKQKTAISNVVSEVFNKPSFIDRGLMYKYAMNKVNTVNLPNGFVGYKLNLSCESNLSLHIKRVLLEFSGTGNIKLLLFHTSKLAPIQTKVVNVTSELQEVVLDWVVDNTDGIYGGDYYIGYLTGGLTVTPYKRDYQNSNVISSFKYLYIEPVLIPNHTTEVLFNLTNYEGFAEYTGMNIDFTVNHDYTDLVINNEFLFSKAVMYMMQILCLQVSISSYRRNRNELLGESMVSKLLVEIEGANDGVMNKKGIKEMFYSSITKIKAEVERLQNGYFGIGLMIDTDC